MLGITTPDAIAFGTLVIGLLAAWRGSKAGEEAKKADPVHPTSTNTMKDLELLASAISLNTGALLRLTSLMEEDAKRHDIDDEVQKRLDARSLLLIADQLKQDRDRRT